MTCYTLIRDKRTEQIQTTQLTSNLDTKLVK